MNIEEFKRIHTKVQKQIPNLFLSGSIALNLSGKIKRNSFGDIDYFCCESADLNLEGFHSEGEYEEDFEKFETLSKYYKLGDKFIKVNLFVWRQDLFKKLNIQECKGYKIMKPLDILDFKMDYNRDKDIKDLKEYIRSFE